MQLYLDKNLVQFGKCLTPLCLYSKYNDEAPVHIFYKCEIVNTVWNKLSMDDENLFFFVILISIFTSYVTFFKLNTYLIKS